MSTTEQNLNGVTAEPVVPATPAEPLAPAAPAGEPSKPPDPNDLRAVVEYAAKTPRNTHAQHQPREQGRFAGPPQIPVAPAVPAIVRPEMPKSLKKELEAHWKTAHPELAVAIHQRELDYNKGMEIFKPAKAQLDELLNEFKPYEHLLKAEGATPAAAIRSLMQTAAILRSGNPALKVQHAVQMMRQFGISLESLQQAFSGQPLPQPALDPQSVQQLVQQQVQQQLDRERQQQGEERSSAAVTAFAADPANKHFASVSDDMLEILSSPQFHERNSGKSEVEKLHLAYGRACQLNPDISKQLAAEQQAKEAAERQAAQAAQAATARQAAVQVHGAPASGPAPNVDPNDLTAVVRNAFARHR